MAEGLSLSVSYGTFVRWKQQLNVIQYYYSGQRKFPPMSLQTMTMMATQSTTLARFSFFCFNRYNGNNAPATRSKNSSQKIVSKANTPYTREQG